MAGRLLRVASSSPRGAGRGPRSWSTRESRRTARGAVRSESRIANRFERQLWCSGNEIRFSNRIYFAVDMDSDPPRDFFLIVFSFLKRERWLETRTTEVEVNYGTIKQTERRDGSGGADRVGCSQQPAPAAKRQRDQKDTSERVKGLSRQS